MTLEETCRMVARTIMSEIGPWGERCALFGGLIPGLLVPEPPGGLAHHIGTRDVDLALRVAALGDERDMYRTLKQNLANLGLQQSSDPSFAWHRTVSVQDSFLVDAAPREFKILVELFVPVDDPSQFGRIQRKPIAQSGSNLTALGIFGLDLIERDIEIIEDEGPLLDDLGIKKVNLRVCGPAMLLALKAWALTERNKTKDGYDVVWTLKALGPEALATRFRDAGLHQTDFGKQAIQRLEECFSTPAHTGPIGWVKESNFEGDEAARELRDAVGIVSEFVQAVRG